MSGTEIGYIHEAFEQNWIDAQGLKALADPLTKNSYGDYLMNLLRRGRSPASVAVTPRRGQPQGWQQGR